MLRIGLIGAGRIGRVHARSVCAHPDAELVIVADAVENAARDLAHQCRARWTVDADEVFADTAVDAVIICSPTPLHAPQVLAAAAAGIPVLCEKPLAPDATAAADLVARLDGLDPLVMLGFNRRFDPSFAAIHDAVTDGRIGDLEQLTIVSRDPTAPSKDYIANSGGIFADMTIHDFDLARFFLGDIVSVYALGQHLDPDLADTGDFDGAVITLANDRGATATIINSRHCASGYDQRIEAFGQRGSLTADNIRATTVRYCGSEMTDAQGRYLDFFLDRYHAAYARELDAFLTAVSTGRRPAPGIEDGIAALRLAEAADESARTGRAVVP
ncbi:inositol 2-dehydrogenase [Actinomyces sp. B33]|uniref:inositol 2-dehydrogenase n=1 Tax=Actinomyces sp. B33 TaxID=2942131 RepID=UPI0023419C9D|nr:inositol 2-dehydrogenase [Actinomyces sp. B33]MDC4232485.1 inositol 2-dehydrogenase [Actinomyces sp. B33]